MTTREALVRELRGYRAALLEAISGATPEELRFAPEGRWSIQDLMGHLAAWQQETMRRLQLIARGEKPAGVDDLAAWNAAQVERRRGWSLEQQRAEFDQAQAQFERTVVELPDGLLAQPRVRWYIRSIAGHDDQHVPSVLERLARARGRRHEAAIHWVDYARRQIIQEALVGLSDEDYDERLPGKWSIKEILIHLSDRDRRWAEVLRRHAAGDPDAEAAARHESTAALNRSNEAYVNGRAHWTVPATLHEFGAARGAWNQALLAIPAERLDREPVKRWIERRRGHDLMHLPGLEQRALQARRRAAAANPS